MRSSRARARPGGAAAHPRDRSETRSGGASRVEAATTSAGYNLTRAGAAALRPVRSTMTPNTAALRLAAFAGAGALASLLLLRRRRRRGAKQWLHVMRDELYVNVLPFWLRTHDAERGGFLSCVSRDGTLFDADKKYIWLNGRATYVFAEMARVRDATHVAAASRGGLTSHAMLAASRMAADFLLQHAVRNEDGNCWFCLTADGF